MREYYFSYNYNGLRIYSFNNFIFSVFILNIMQRK